MATPFNIFDFHKKPKRKKNLMEFRAGKMKMNEDNWVYPDKRKGLVFIHQTSDGLMHFCWKDRITGKVEDDLVIFPDETIFKRLPQCNTGRVFLLKFKNSKKLFLWMQEPKEDNDVELCMKVNELLNPKSKTTASNGSKVVNMNDLTELLGELNEIGALNDIDLLELLAQGFGSQVSNESDFPTPNQTAPFPIGTTGSYPTDAERQSSILLGPLNHSTKLGISSLETQITKDGNQSDYKRSVSGISTNDLTNILSDDSIKRLLENQNFRNKVLHTDLEISQETIERLLIHNSEENNNLMKTLFEILSNREMSLELIQEMGLPETIISAISEYDLTSVLQALEQYFQSLASNQPN